METYTCECCGKVLEDWPSLAFKTPDSYYWLSDEDKANSTISDDFCVVNTEGETYRFIRVVMFIEVINSCQELHYGVWVSLSEASFNDYNEYPTSTGFVLKSNIDSMTFNNFHEGLHIGVIMSMRKFMMITGKCFRIRELTRSLYLLPITGMPL